VSLVADFLIKVTGKADVQQSGVAEFPWADTGQTAKSRALRLNCLTSDYSNLWSENASKLVSMTWSSDDSRLDLEGPVAGPLEWELTAGLRTDFSRRMALVEIDVLVAQSLGLALDQLIEIYRIYFPVLQENETGTWYDQRGRIVWTCSKGLPGVGHLMESNHGEWKSPGRATWEAILAADPEELVSQAIDDTQPGGPREVIRHFVGPFTRCDRIEDYKRAWVHFETLKAEGGS
jgi:hypothetical protein